jgi:uncharacterized protein (DUF952 family)
LPTILHITTASTWKTVQQQGIYEPESLTTEGFIHTSTIDQVLTVAEKFFSDVPDLVLLVINTERVKPEIRYEQGTHDTDDNVEKFPHIYGPLNLDAIVIAVPLQPEVDGTFTLPTLPLIP